MTTTQLELYHRASVYQLRRALEQLKPQIVPLLNGVLGNKAPEWATTNIHIDDLQLFRCVSLGNNAPRFRWLTYFANSLTVSQFKLWREYFQSEDGKRVANSLQYLVNSSTQGLTAINLLRSALTRSPEPTQIDLLEAHHALLLIFTSIQTSGFMLGILAKQVENLNGESTGILTQIEARSSNITDLPSFWSSVAQVHVSEPNPVPTKGFAEKYKQPNIQVHFDNSASCSSEDLIVLQRFFQDRLYPFFSYPKLDSISTLSENPTTSGQRKQGIFGFIVLPLHLAYLNREGTSVGGVGQWQGVVVAHLVSNTNIGDEMRKTPCLNQTGFDALKSIPIRTALQSLAERLVESDAITVIQSEPFPESPLEAFLEGFSGATGWTLDPESDIANCASPVERVQGNPSVLRIGLDWDWPRQSNVAARTVRIRIPGLPPSRNGDGLGGLHEVDAILLPQVFHTCNQVYHSIFTLWHAQRSVQQNQFPLRELKEGMKGWFKHPVWTASDIIPHGYSEAAQDKNRHLLLTKKLFPFVKDSWWEDEGSFRKLHEHLKSLCNAFWPDTRENETVTVGALYLILLLAVTSRFGAPYAQGLAPPIFPSELGEQDTVYTNNDALTSEALCARVYTLLLEVIELREHRSRTNSSAIRNIEARDRAVFVDLEWSPGDVENFFKKYKRLLVRTLAPLAAVPVLSNFFALSLAGQIGRAADAKGVGPEGMIELCRDDKKFVLKIG